MLWLQRTHKRRRNTRERATGPSGRPWEGGVILLFIVLYYRQLNERHLLTQVLGYPALAIISAFVVLSCASTRPSAVLTAFFGSWILRRFGTYSYGIYVYHMALRPQFEMYCSTTALAQNLNLPRPVAGVAHGGLAILVFGAIAATSYHLFEQPILKLKDTYFKSTSRSALPLRSSVSSG